MEGSHEKATDRKHQETDNVSTKDKYFAFLDEESSFGARKAEVLNSLIINTTAKANDTADILQTFR